MIEALCVYMVLMLWFLWCNETTFEDRRNIAYDIFERNVKRIDKGKPWDRESYNVLEKTSYHKHLWYRITFRNPLHLYR
jgi:hypothetical protein